MAEEGGVSTASAESGSDAGSGDAQFSGDDFEAQETQVEESQEVENEDGEEGEERESRQAKAAPKKESRSKVEKPPEGEEEEETEEEGEEEGEREGEEEEEKPAAEKKDKPKGELDDSTPVSYKVDGKEIVRPFGEVKRLASMSEAAGRRFEEAAKMRKAYEAGVELIIREPDRALMSLFTQRLGSKEKAREYLVAMADRIVAEDYEEKQLPPHERKIRDLQRENAEIKAALDRRQAQEYEEELAAKTEAFRQRRVRDIRGALKGAGMSADDKRLVLAVDNLMWEAKDRGYDLSAADAAQELLSQRRTAMMELAKTASLKELMAAYPDLESKVNQATLRRVKGEIARRQRDGEATNSARAQPPGKKIYRDMEELLADQRNR